SRDGLSDQTVIKPLENVRSYRAFERALVGSVDPRSVLELALVHRLASLLWRLGVPARSKPASLRCTPNFGSHAGRTAPADPVNRGRSKLPPKPMVTR